MSGDRIPCIVEGCRRTAPADRYEPGAEIICRKHMKLAPPKLRHRYKELRARRRKLERRLATRLKAGTINQSTAVAIIDIVWRQQDKNWDDIKASFNASGKPLGLDAFLEEAGLA